MKKRQLLSRHTHEKIFGFLSRLFVLSLFSLFIISRTNVVCASSPYNFTHEVTHEFEDPSDVTIDTVRHRLFVSEFSNYRVLVFDTDSNGVPIDDTPEFVLGQQSVEANPQIPFSPAANNIYTPYGLSFDEEHNRLFVLDYWFSRILVFDFSSGISNNMDASYVIGQENFTSSTDGHTQDSISYPHALHFNPTTQYLTVADDGNQRVLIFDLSSGISNGMNASYVLGQSNFTDTSSGLSDAKFNRPQGVHYDNDNQRIFVSDAQNNRVLVFDVSLGITNGMSASYVLGQSNFTSNNSATTINGLSWPTYLTYENIGKKLFISDISNNRVMVFDLTSGLSNNMNASNVIGQTDFNSVVYSPAANGFYEPYGIFFNSTSQYLYVTDTTNNRVVGYDTTTIVNGEQPAYILGNNLELPMGATIDSVNHRLFVADEYNYVVDVFNLTENNELVDFSPEFILGDGQSGPSSTAIYDPYGGLAYDYTTNYLYVAEYGNARILVFDLNNIQSGMAASYVIGAPDLDSSGCGCASQSEIGYMWGALVLDTTTHRLFVADIENNRILVFDLTQLSNGMNASYVLGQLNFDSIGESTS